MSWPVPDDGPTCCRPAESEYAIVRLLEAKSVDETLELLDLLMETSC
ncbi:hypothetical protein ACIBQ6_34260 [Nonomuraea sp. NPDC049655]